MTRTSSPGERAHAADGNVPAAGAAADHVVKETAVLHQTRVVERRERADQRVGGDDSAHQIVAERALEQSRQRRLEHAMPRGIVINERRERLTGAQRLGERPERPRGESTDDRAERRELCDRGVGPSVRCTDAAPAAASSLTKIPVSPHGV